MSLANLIEALGATPFGVQFIQQKMRAKMKIKVTLNHEQLVNMFCGGHTPSGSSYTNFVGNQWNEEWEWDKDAIRDLPTLQLAKMLFGEDFEVVDG